MNENINNFRISFLIFRFYFIYAIIFLFLGVAICYCFSLIFYSFFVIDGFLLKYVFLNMILFFLFKKNYPKERRQIIVNFNNEEYDFNENEKKSALDKKINILKLEILQLAVKMKIDCPRICLIEEKRFAAEKNILYISIDGVKQYKMDRLRVICAHEMAHIKINDCFLFVFLDLLLKFFSVLFCAYPFLYSSWFVFILGSLLFCFFLLFISKIIIVFISRLRECVADALAVKYTGDFEPLISLFEEFKKIEDEIKRDIFCNHPTQDERIKALKKLKLSDSDKK